MPRSRLEDVLFQSNRHLQLHEGSIVALNSISALFFCSYQLALLPMEISLITPSSALAHALESLQASLASMLLLAACSWI